MRTPFIAGNWKMNKTASEAAVFIGDVKTALSVLENVEVAFCPTAIAIPAAAAAASGSKVGIGAQNMHFEANGAWTGELSAEMVEEYCAYVILGHSERRQFFGETDEGVNKKTKVALAHGIVPIVCCGESLEQNEAGETQAFVSGQVRAALDGISAENVPTIVFAYEPIWAIGTGRSADAESANNLIKTCVRDTIAELYGSEVAEQVRIQYGGSVKPHNIAEYMAQPDIDGALVGGASLTAAFVDLVRNGIS